MCSAVCTVRGQKKKRRRPLGPPRLKTSRSSFFLVAAPSASTQALEAHRIVIGH
jgi:hypothetical protein